MVIFEFSDYRRFLREWIAARPGRGRGEMNRIAKYIGVHPSLMSQVLGDTKNLSLEQTQLLGEYLQLTARETDYLILLAQVQRAGSAKLKAYFKSKLEQQRSASLDLSKRVRQDKELSDQEKAVFYSHWTYAAVWLATSLTPTLSPEEIAARFRISREKCMEILAFLTETRLCVIEEGHYKMGPQSIHLERDSVFLSRHHTNWRLRAIEASDRISQEELMYTAPISISCSDFKKIRSRLTEVIKEITDIAIDSQAEEVACFHLDFFHPKP